MAAHDAPIGILTFEPILKSKVWGGDRLARFGKPCAPGDAIGESWEVADLASTSVSGGGGGAAHSVIARGALTGQTIGRALTTWGDRFCRDASGGAADSFPLLIKFLDARENLSVQVHPSPAYAAAHADAHLKTESWLILDATPNGALYLGLEEGVGREELARAVEEGQVESVMRRVPAIAGECHHLPTGLVHALGAGVLVAEVQTPSDTTFRLWDWGRTDRELHIEPALECALLSPPPAPTSWHGEGERTLVESEAYRLTRINVAAGGRCAFDVSNATVVMTLAGVGTVSAEVEGAEDQVALSPGVTAIVPACASACEIEADAASPCSVLLARVQPE